MDSVLDKIFVRLFCTLDSFGDYYSCTILNDLINLITTIQISEKKRPIHKKRWNELNLSSETYDIRSRILESEN